MGDCLMSFLSCTLAHLSAALQCMDPGAWHPPCLFLPRLLLHGSGVVLLTTSCMFSYRFRDHGDMESKKRQKIEDELLDTQRRLAAALENVGELSRTVTSHHPTHENGSRGKMLDFALADARIRRR